MEIRYEITTEALLAAYMNGYFPMAEQRDDPEIHWFYPEMRGIIPLDAFHIPKSLAKIVRQNRFDVRIDTAFNDVICACAETSTQKNSGRNETWINDRIISLYSELAQLGHAHSVECWLDNALVGGLYGVSIGGAFFGESMFSRVDNASKVALVHLVERLIRARYVLLDTQYVNPHLTQFGVKEIPREDYLARLKDALAVKPNPSLAFNRSTT